MLDSCSFLVCCAADAGLLPYLAAVDSLDGQLAELESAVAQLDQHSKALSQHNTLTAQHSTSSMDYTLTFYRSQLLSTQSLLPV